MDGGHCVRGAAKQRSAVPSTTTPRPPHYISAAASSSAPPPGTLHLPTQYTHTNKRPPRVRSAVSAFSIHATLYRSPRQVPNSGAGAGCLHVGACRGGLMACRGGGLLFLSGGCPQRRSCHRACNATPPLPPPPHGEVLTFQGSRYPRSFRARWRQWLHSCNSGSGRQG